MWSKHENDKGKGNFEVRALQVHCKRFHQMATFFKTKCKIIPLEKSVPLKDIVDYLHMISNCFTDVFRMRSQLFIWLDFSTAWIVFSKYPFDQTWTLYAPDHIWPCGCPWPACMRWLGNYVSNVNMNKSYSVSHVSHQALIDKLPIREWLTAF